MHTKDNQDTSYGVTERGSPTPEMWPGSISGGLNLAIDAGEPHIASLADPFSTLQHNAFETNLDDLWSADLLSLDAGITDLGQIQSMDWLQQPPEPSQATRKAGMPQHGPEYGFNIGDLLEDYREPAAPISSTTAIPPKVGHRFTLDSLRALKDWFSRHNDNPYPNEEQKIMLERQTGLSRMQITNWLANARRRRPTTDSSTQTTSGKGGNTPPDYTPTRAGTPIPRRQRLERDMHPLQRYIDSPPENEPAAVSAIAQAMASGDLVSSSELLRCAL
ncbi:hypothetical protein ACHAPU_001070 [Fusarium lateritium]